MNARMGAAQSRTRKATMRKNTTPPPTKIMGLIGDVDTPAGQHVLHVSEAERSFGLTFSENGARVAHRADRATPADHARRSGRSSHDPSQDGGPSMTPRHTTPAPVAFVPWVTVGGTGGPLPGRRQARRGRSGARRPARAGMDRAPVSAGRSPVGSVGAIFVGASIPFSFARRSMISTARRPAGTLPFTNSDSARG